MNYTDKQLEDKAWDMILKLKQCPQGHIISPYDVVQCMVKFAKSVNEEPKNVVKIR